MNKVFLALGSNLQNPVQQILSAMKELAEIENTSVVRHSSLYLNPPEGMQNQPDFVNAVSEIQTRLSAENLLAELLELENKHQRVRNKKNGPRTLDLDILLFDDKKINLPKLQIPHPRLKERAFVVVPLAEIAPELVLPCGTTVKDLLPNFKKNSLEKLTHFQRK